MDDNEFIWWWKFILSTVLPIVIITSMIWFTMLQIIPSDDKGIEYKPQYIFDNNKLVELNNFKTEALENVCKDYKFTDNFYELKYSKNVGYICVYKHITGTYKYGESSYLEEIPMMDLIQQNKASLQSFIEENQKLEANIIVSVPLLNKMNSEINLTWLCNDTNNTYSMIQYDYIEEWRNTTINITDKIFNETCNDDNCSLNYTEKSFNVFAQQLFDIPKWSIKYEVNFCNFTFLDDWNDNNLSFEHNLTIYPTSIYRYSRLDNGTYLDYVAKVKKNVWVPVNLINITTTTDEIYSNGTPIHVYSSKFTWAKFTWE